VRAPRRQRGYTLLEVVVAFAILVLSLGALYESFSMTLRRSEKAGNRIRAVLLAESLRDRLGVELPLSQPEDEGVEADCRWQVRVQPMVREGLEQPPSMVAENAAVDVECGGAGVLGRAHLDTVELAAAQ
jgi:general secretion pathway protein I